MNKTFGNGSSSKSRKKEKSIKDKEIGMSFITLIPQSFKGFCFHLCCIERKKIELLCIIKYE